MSSFRYQIGFLGQDWLDRLEIKTLLHAAFDNLGLDRDLVDFFDENELHSRDRKAPFVGIFVGYAGAELASHPGITSILEDSLPLIPVVDSLNDFRGKVPLPLAGVNGMAITNAADKARLVSVILENLKLLRADRRLFISYRRAESTNVAIQLYEALDARGFDVFLDTKSIAPAADVQNELFHRLSDSDIVILLDTPDFRISTWTVQELTQANATNIQILHLLWPGVNPDPGSAFSDFFPLSLKSFRLETTPDLTSKLSDECIVEVCQRAESLRARALAARYAYLVDSFCDIARAHGCDVAVNPERYLSVSISGREHAVFPAVGVPNARRLEVFEGQLRHHTPMPTVRVIYDERGVLDQWRGHLAWLSDHLPVKAIRLTDVPHLIAAGAI